MRFPWPLPLPEPGGIELVCYLRIQTQTEIVVHDGHLFHLREKTAVEEEYSGHMELMIGGRGIITG